MKKSRPFAKHPSLSRYHATSLLALGCPSPNAEPVINVTFYHVKINIPYLNIKRFTFNANDPFSVEFVVS